MIGGEQLELPKFYRYLKIAQVVLAILLLALSAYQVSVISWSGADLMLFTSLFSIITLVYNILATHSLKNAYNWVALIVLDGLANIFWLASWALMASVAGAAVVVNEYYDAYDDTFYYVGLQTFSNVVIASLVFGLIEWILYCVTLGFLSAAIHKHTKSYGTSQPAQPAAQPATGDRIEMETV